MSDLFREALRSYEALKLPAWLENARAYAVTRNPQGYTEEDLPRLIREVRSEERQRQKKIRRAG